MRDFVLTLLLFFGSPAYADIIAQWPLDDSLEDTVGVLHGRSTGTISFVTGHDGQPRGALRLYVERVLPEPAHVELHAVRGVGVVPASTATEFSLVLWVNGASQSGRAVYTESSTEGDGSFIVGTGFEGNSDKARVLVRAQHGGGATSITSTKTVFDSTWHHLAIVQLDSQISIYVDGLLDRVVSLTSGARDPLNLAALGALLDAGGAVADSHFVGLIDEVQIHDVALTASEVAGLAGLCAVPALVAVRPGRIFSAGGTSVDVLGSGFTEEHVVSVGGEPLVGQVLVNSGTIRGSTAPLASGLHDVAIRCADSGLLVASLEEAVESFDAAQIDRVEPNVIPLEGGIDVEVIGANFLPDSVVAFDGIPLRGQSPSTAGFGIVGFAPELQAPGPKDVTVTDFRGTVTLEGGVTYGDPALDCVPDPEVEVQELLRRLYPPDGGTIIFMFGNFTEGATYSATVGGEPVLDFGHTSLPGQELAGTMPDLPVGFHDLVVYCEPGGVPIPNTAGSIEVAPIPILHSVVPDTVPAEGGMVTFVGDHFRSKFELGGETEFWVETENGLFYSATDVVVIDAQHATGIVPPVSFGNSPSLVVSISRPIRVEGENGFNTLPDAITYVPDRFLIGPGKIETSLAYGTIRMSWENPVEYDALQILSEEGVVLHELSGDATSFEFAPPTLADEVGLYIRGVQSDGTNSDKSFTMAKRLVCDDPPPVDQILDNRFYGAGLSEGTGDGFEFADVQFSLYGGHEPADVVRCGSTRNEVVAQATAGSDPHVLGPGIGYVGPVGPSELVTGFTLHEPAQKLEIAVHYARLASAFGLELRGHLIQVSGEGNLEDEFTFGDVVVSTVPGWHRLIYFRADSDVGRDLVDDLDLGPRPCPRQDGGCGILEIPAGEYVLKIYAVGGDPDVPYFAVTSDPTPEEILVPGTPCPPYPLVRVRDVSGIDTLPTITEITATTFDVQNSCSGDDLRVRLQAEGTWLDACGNVSVLGFHEPRFTFAWRVFESGQPRPVGEGHETFVDLCLGCGCYLVELDVGITGCPVKRTITWEIVVEPLTATCRDTGNKFHFSYPRPDPIGAVGVVGIHRPPYNDLGRPPGSAPHAVRCVRRAKSVR